jgi:hypothetical protein
MTKPRIVWSIVWLLGSASAVAAVSRAPSGPREPHQGRTAETHSAASETLKLARSAVGLAGEIKALEVDGTRTRQPGPAQKVDAFHLRLLLPDCFQQSSSTITHTLAGDVFWQRPKTNAEASETARRAMTFRFRETVITLLLTLPDAWPLVTAKDTGIQTVGSLRGTALEFSAADGFRLTLVLDPKSREPLGYALPQRASDGGTDLRVITYTAFQTVGRARLPLTLDETIAAFHSVTNLARITVNPALSPRSFRD